MGRKYDNEMKTRGSAHSATARHHRRSRTAENVLTAKGDPAALVQRHGLICHRIPQWSCANTLSEGFSHFVTSMAAPLASGWSGRRVGLAPVGKRRLVTPLTQTGHPASFQRTAVDPDQDDFTSSVQTLKLTSVLGPNAVLMATSIASRPLAISIRQIRGTLLRASKVYKRPPT
jgi:hypothetical protein